MSKLGIISNLVYSLERSLGWCPKPPTVKAESATYHEDGSPKSKWWWWGVALFPVWLLYSPLSPPIVQFYTRLTIGTLGVVFFGIMGLTNIVHAYQKRERIYYLRIVLSFLMCFGGISLFLGNIILALIFLLLSFLGIPIAKSSLKHHESRSEKRRDYPSSGVAETK